MGKRNIAIIGNGNVTIDILRIFSRTKDILDQTDIYGGAQDRILKNDIENFFVIGRRGAV